VIGTLRLRFFLADYNFDCRHALGIGANTDDSGLRFSFGCHWNLAHHITSFPRYITHQNATRVPVGIAKETFIGQAPFRPSGGVADIINADGTTAPSPCFHAEEI